MYSPVLNYWRANNPEVVFLFPELLAVNFQRELIHPSRTVMAVDCAPFIPGLVEKNKRKISRILINLSQFWPWSAAPNGQTPCHTIYACSNHMIPGVPMCGSEGARSVPQGCLPVCLTSQTAASSDPPALRDDLTGLIYNVRLFKTISPACWQQSCIYKLAETLTFRLIITSSEGGKLTSAC